jgi:arsenate reductase
MTLYGIKNCNTVKAAITWLKTHNIEFEFHDYKSRGITAEKLNGWSKQVGWDALINRRGTTWRQLHEDVQARVTSQAAAVALMLEKTSVIRRPLIEKHGKIVALGFAEEEYAGIFS